MEESNPKTRDHPTTALSAGSACPKDKGERLVSIIVPNLNGEDLLERCLDPLARGDARREVILVDNGSTDQSVAVARRTLPSIRVIANRRNEGYARACNQGAEIASSEYLLFLNSDVVLSEKCLNELLAWAAREPDAGAWQPKLLRQDGSTWDSAGSFFTRTGFLWHEGLKERGPDKFASPRDMFSLKGACFLVRRDRFFHAGRFDEDFFAYFEETDLCWRLQLSGWKVRYVPVCCALHTVGATTARYFRPEQIDYLSFRNRIVSIVKSAGTATLMRVLPLHIAACLGLSALFILRGQWPSAKAIVSALLWCLANAKELAWKRRQSQALRVHPDQRFLVQVTVPMTMRRARHLMASYLPRW